MTGRVAVHGWPWQFGGPFESRRREELGLSALIQGANDGIAEES
jgi:hypothetical protein